MVSWAACRIIAQSGREVNMADLLKDIRQCHCLRCGHDWVTRKPGTPVNCPKCTSPYWDRERIKDSNAAKSRGVPEHE